MKKITFLFALIAMFFSFNVSAQDTCGAAVVVTSGATNNTTITDTTAGAEMAATNGDVAGNDSKWYTFTPPANGTIDVSACGGGSDTRLYIGTGTCGALTVVANNDDDCDLGNGNAWASRVTGVPVTMGTVYYIEWDDRWEDGVAFDWVLTFLTCTPPAGTTAVIDDCGNNQFTVDVDVTTLGNAASVTISNDGGVGSTNVSATGIVNVGPFTAGTPVVITLEHDGDSSCNVVMPAVIDGCPPVNDDCANAIAIACAGNVTGSTAAATDSGMGSNGAADVWYSFTGSGATEDVTLDLCASGYDTYVRVYDGCAGTEIVGNDDFCATQSQVTFTSDGTSTYYIMIEGFGTNTGNYDMTLTCAPNIPAPANDECGAATALTLGVTVIGETTAGATQSAGEQPSCDLFGSIADVWYSFVAPASGEATVQTTITGTSDQANVAIYSDCSNTQAMEVAGGCVDGNGGESVAVTGLTPGNTYYVQVWSDGATSRSAQRIEGTFDLFVEDTVILNVDNFDLSENFRYFPNPVDDKLTVSAQNNIESLSIVNMLGQTVKTVQPNLSNYDLDFTDLSSGVYFVKATINDIEGTFRIIKK